MTLRGVVDRRGDGAAPAELCNAVADDDVELSEMILVSRAPHED
jgi:hypothetical protein